MVGWNNDIRIENMLLRLGAAVSHCDRCYLVVVLLAAFVEVEDLAGSFTGILRGFAERRERHCCFTSRLALWTQTYSLLSATNMTRNAAVYFDGMAEQAGGSERIYKRECWIWP